MAWCQIRRRISVGRLDSKELLGDERVLACWLV